MNRPGIRGGRIVDGCCFWTVISLWRITVAAAIRWVTCLRRLAQPAVKRCEGGIRFR